eukprot:1221810-Prorocentrum_lima.AAC.1
MTSSLVGSEMCIRDSILTARSRGLPAPPSPLFGRTSAEMTTATPTSSPGCLLYTSDAADDM